MEYLTPKILLKRIHNFVKEYDDYNPMNEFKKKNSIGYYNMFYHDSDFCIAEKEMKSGKMIPFIVIGCEAADDGTVYVVSNTMKRYNLQKCGEKSILSVYQTLPIDR